MKKTWRNISLNTKVCRSSKIISYHFADRVYLINPDNGQVRILNPVAGLIWKSAAKPTRLAAIVPIIRKNFAATLTAAQSDLIGFAAKYLKLGLLTYKNEK